MMLEFSIQKFKEAEFSLEPTIHSQSSLFAFLQIRIEKRLCCLSSRELVYQATDGVNKADSIVIAQAIIQLNSTVIA